MDRPLDGRILIVDDEPVNVRLLERLLQHAGYSRLHSTTDPREALRLFPDVQPDIVLLDLLMPHMDGFAVMQALGPLIPEGVYLPIVVLTADATRETKTRALAAGAKDFLTKPFDTTEVVLRIANLLETRRLNQALALQNEQLEAQVRERTERLLQTEKVATMGALLAGVAHELNNPLTIITGRTFLFQAALGDSPLAAQAAQIAQAAERCVRIIRNFLAMARQWPPERGRVHLASLVRETVEFVAYELRVADVEVEIGVADDLPPIWADRHQLQQLLVNLVVNAHHAMREAPEPRRLSIAARADRAAGPIELVVADTGPGIPPELQVRIFEPFFTTKPLGHGTGLGLSLCRGIVESHGGTIRLAPRPGGGACFVVELPLGAAETAEAEIGVADDAPAPRGKEILVVDDEPDVAGILAEMLTAEGHHVDTAPDGVAALEKLRRQSYDLILSDSGMPGLDGPGLYRAAERLDPALTRRFIFLSADALNPKTTEFFDAIGARRIHKPFAMERVRQTVRRALSESS